MATETVPDGKAEEVILDPKTIQGIEYYKAEAKKAFEERDKERKVRKEYEDRLKLEEQAKLEQTQEYKKKFEEIYPQFEQLKTFKQSYDEQVQRNLEEAEKALPKDHAGEYELLKTYLPTEKRIDWISQKLAANQSAEPKDSPANTRPGSTSAGATNEVSTMSFSDKVKLYKANPNAFKKLIGSN